MYKTSEGRAQWPLEGFTATDSLHLKVEKQIVVNSKKEHAL